MTQAPTRQRTLTLRHKITQKSLANIELPKINSKVQQANAFLSNPLQLSKLSQDNDSDKEEQEHVAAEPWMEYAGQSNALRMKKAIEAQIANIMGTEKNETSGEKITNQVQDLSPLKIISKMKKYQPINSSFSLLYGEKKNIQERSFKGHQISQARRRKILNLPPLHFRGHSNHSKMEMEQRIQELYSLRPSRTPKKQPQRFKGYINKIKEIQKQGDSLHHKSQTLIHRIDKVSQFLQHRFQTFNQQSENMLSDVGTYRLQEQTTGQYKKDLLQAFSQRLRK